MMTSVIALFAVSSPHKALTPDANQLSAELDAAKVINRGCTQVVTTSPRKPSLPDVRQRSGEPHAALVINRKCTQLVMTSLRKPPLPDVSQHSGEPHTARAINYRCARVANNPHGGMQMWAGSSQCRARGHSQRELRSSSIAASSDKQVGVQHVQFF